VVGTDVSEEHIASIFRAGESRQEYSEQVAATSVLTRTTWHQIPKDDFLHRHRRENLKSYIKCVCLRIKTLSVLHYFSFMPSMFVLTSLASVPCILFSLVGRLSFVFQTENNLEQRERFYSQTNAFLYEQQYAIVWNTLTYDLVQCDSLNTRTIA
jgi:hypothetical protein